MILWTRLKLVKLLCVCVCGCRLPTNALRTKQGLSLFLCVSLSLSEKKNFSIFLIPIWLTRMLANSFARFFISHFCCIDLKSGNNSPKASSSSTSLISFFLLRFVIYTFRFSQFALRRTAKTAPLFLAFSYFLRVFLFQFSSVLLPSY